VKAYRLIWLLPVPFIGYVLWIVTAYVFGTSAVNDDVFSRVLVALFVATLLTIPGLAMEIQNS
jgi:uncharacterized membrane protein